MTDTPRTAAGRALLADLVGGSLPPRVVPQVRDAILAIEAAALDVEALATALHAADVHVYRTSSCNRTWHFEQAQKIAATYAEQVKP